MPMYTYRNLLDELNFLSRCGGCKVGSLGVTRDDRTVPYIFIGKKTGPQIIVTGGIHAREHISSYLVMRQAEYALCRTQGTQGDGVVCHSVPSAQPEPTGFAHGGVYFVPMLNPDGNVIAEKGAAGILNPAHRELVRGILRGKDSALYKANAAGVDLNVNFDAKWGTGRLNTRIPGTENYIGTAPFSEPETRALADFTHKLRPAATVSYHAIGRELYYEFGQTGDALARDLAIAEYLNERLGYKIVPDEGTSVGGYKDWCIRHFGIPSFTIELGEHIHPHPLVDYSVAAEDIARNLDLPERLLQAVIENKK